jgi:hypothetical protein
VREVAGGMSRPRIRTPHPLEHHPSFRAVISAAPHLAELARELKTEGDDLVSALAVACGDLVHGFSSPPGSRDRNQAHHRAWIAVREIDRAIVQARTRRLAPARVVARAQRAIDRADVMIGALLPD